MSIYEKANIKDDIIIIHKTLLKITENDIKEVDKNLINDLDKIKQLLGEYLD